MTVSERPASAFARRITGRPLSGRQRRWCAIGLLVVLIVIGLIVLTPGAPAVGAQDSLIDHLDTGHVKGTVPTSVTYDRIEWTANVVMFLPLGFLLAALFPPRRRFWAVPICVGTSSAIELAQRFWIVGRFSSVADVVANSLGGILGMILLIGLSQRGRRSPLPAPN